MAARSIYANTREVCGRHKLMPGDYVIVPTTFQPNEEAKFLLRIFSERPYTARHVVLLLFVIYIYEIRNKEKVVKLNNNNKKQISVVAVVYIRESLETKLYEDTIVGKFGFLGEV